jgi:hypothetical protein
MIPSHDADATAEATESGITPRASLQFMWYRRAIGHTKAGVGPTWRISTDELYELIRAGAKAINGSDRPPSLHGPPRGETLEEVVEALAKAENWTRRLSGFLKGLNGSEARAAVDRLVKLGCPALPLHLQRKSHVHLELFQVHRVLQGLSRSR